MKFKIKSDVVKKKNGVGRKRQPKHQGKGDLFPHGSILTNQIQELRKEFEEEERKDNERLFAALVIWPILWGALLYLLCKLGIFCLTDWLGINRRPNISNQILELEGDKLAISQGNSVDLSVLHDVYEAGAGLELIENKFKLQETGVEPGTYGSSTQVPILTIDKYGRITFAGTAPIDTGPLGILTINDSPGPHINILGQEHQILVSTTGSDIKITTPQDIDITSEPTFAGLHLTGILYDRNGDPGTAGYVLVATGDGVEWQSPLDVLNDHDEQTLSWDPNTFDLSIENGNTVNLSSLAIWEQQPIGGYYSTDLVKPRDPNVQRIFLEHTGWGLTELQIKNDDNSNNYSGAVLSLKGSGPEYTNNMFFAKLGDNYYVPSWAGKGVVSTDQPLIIASVKSNDPDHPNKTPYIMFQTGGYYTSPVDRMILDSNGNLGINDFAPDDKLTVGGNIHLTGSNPGIIHARLIDLELTTEVSRWGNGDILIHPGDFAGNSGMPKSVYIYAGRQEISPWMAYTGNVVMLVPKDRDEIIGHLLVGSKSRHTDKNPVAEFTIPEDSNYDSLLSLVRFSDNVEGAPIIDQYRMRGDSTSREDVQPGDITGGIRSYALMSPSFYNNASIVFRATSVNSGGGFNGDPGIGGSISLEVSDRNNRQHNALVAFEEGIVGIGIDDMVTDPITGQLTLKAREGDVALHILPNGRDSGTIAFTDTTADQHILALSIPAELNEDYWLFFPPEQGNQYEVMYNNGDGSLLWGTVEHLLSINVGAHAILYSDGNNVVGDPNHLYWDWDNSRMGINTTSPQSPLEIDIGNGTGLVIRKTTSNGTARLIVASDYLPSTNATRVEVTNDSVYGTWYGSVYWLLSRDLWGSGSPGIKLGGEAGMWYKLGTAGGNGIPQRSLIFTTDNKHRAIVTKDGNIGVGTMNPGALFQVGEAGDGTYAIANDWQTFSDRELKDEITPLGSDVLDKVLNLQPVSFVWKKDSRKKKQYGFIAQDVEKIFPNIVSKTKSGLYSVSYTKLIPLIVRALKSLKDNVYTLLYGTDDKPGILKSIEIIGQQMQFKLQSIFEKTVVFMQNVTFKGNVIFENSNMVGTAVIDKGQQEVTVVFSQPLSDVPVVVVTPYSDYVEFRVSKRDKSSFTISVAKPVDAPVEFGWHAFVVKSKK